MKIFKRILAILLAAAMLLSLCSCELLRDVIEGFTENPDEPQNTEPDPTPYNGHYLTELYDPVDSTRDYIDKTRWAGIKEVAEFEMAGETFHNGIRFNSVYNRTDLYFDYDIGGKYKNISFFYGMDSSVRWMADNVSFQVINMDTGKIIWEDLFKVGDIPRFATVDISGINRLRLECYNLKGDVYCMGDITLWEGESEAVDRTYPQITQTTELLDNYRFFHSYSTFTMSTTWQEYRNFKHIEGNELSVKGKTYKHGALLYIAGDDLFMNLRGQFKQISFLWGLSDEQSTIADDFKGYMSIYADGVCVLDEFECNVETPAQTIVLDVNYARQLRIVLRGSSSYAPYFVMTEFKGGENLGASANASTADSPVPLVQTHYPHLVAGTGMGTYVKVYDSSSRYHGFYMGGEKFIEGIVLAPMWDLFSSQANPAYAISDLEGKYKYITFTAGHIDDAAYKPALLEIYLDGEESPSQQIVIKDTDMPKEYTVDVKNCRTIKFSCGGNGEQNLPIIGIANIVCYPDEVVENTVFEPFYKEYPAECELVDYFKPFGWASYNLDKIFYDDGIYADGKYFETYDGKHHNKGLLFCTYHGMNWDHIGMATTLLPVWGMAASGSDQGRHSFYMFNLGGEYKTLTFCTAKAVGSNDGEFEMILGDKPQEGRQFIGVYGDSDDAPLYYTELIDGTIQKHTVDVSGVTRLVFIVPSNGTVMSEVYSAFDITLTK